MGKIAIVGSGVSGLAAAWLLTEHSDHTVEIFEKGDYVGGHTHTIDYAPPGVSGVDPIPVDTGFIVFNSLTYPNLQRFFRHKRVPVVGSDMSFSVTRDDGQFEWAGINLFTLFAQKENLLRLGHWKMIYDIMRFNALAPELLKLPDGHPDLKMTLEQYLDKHDYSEEFRNDYLLPMTAAIWSTPPDKCALDFPALTLLRFMHNHCLLQILNRPQWWCVKNGSREYINALLPILPKVQTSTPITSIKRTPKGATLTTSAGKKMNFDHVIFACHADEALAILGSDATDLERRVLGGIRFSRNEVYVHNDMAYMPRRRAAWASWNYLSVSGKDGDLKGQDVALTYWMNSLQSWLPDMRKYPRNGVGEVLVTMNPPAPGPEPSKTAAHYTYSHPTYTPHLIAAQPAFRLPVVEGVPTLQGTKNTWFAGAWTGYGFHEDGFTSGLQVALALGATAPFEVDDYRYGETREAAETAVEGLVRVALFGWVDKWVRMCFRGPTVARAGAGKVRTF